MVRDKEELKAQIQERIRLGADILAIPVSTQQERASRWASFKRWDDLNYEIIASAFDRRLHQHEYDYKYVPRFDPYVMTGMRRANTLAEDIQEEFNAIAHQIELLRRFHDKIDLQHVAPGVQPKASVTEKDRLPPLYNIVDRFPLSVQQLRHRHNNRATLTITDEYDVQDLMHVLLQPHYDDIRAEEFAPSFAGRSSRMDFLLKDEQVVVEVKMTRANLKAKEIGDELSIDVAHYRAHPDCKRLICFVYDPDGLITNPRGLERDLKGLSTKDMMVEVFIRS